jgi:hypothetical protein
LPPLRCVASAHTSVGLISPSAPMTETSTSSAPVGLGADCDALLPIRGAGRLFRTLRGGLNRCWVVWTGSRWLAVART